MAGNYPNVPSWRMAWDRDGSQAYGIVSGVPTQLTSAEMIALNDETGSSVNWIHNWPTAIIFPELRDLDGFFISMVGLGSAFISNVATSVNTTNGVDGTWVSLVADYYSGAALATEQRTSIRAVTVLGVKAFRYTGSASPDTGTKAVHLYGEISPNQNPNRLVLWHPTLDQRVTPAYFDWGNVPRSSSADKTFRVKNLSAIQTANSIRVAQEILSDTVPSVVGQHTLSLDAVTFLAQVNIGNLAPGAISTQTLTLRRVTPVNAVLSLWCHRVFAEATTWT